MPAIWLSKQASNPRLSPGQPNAFVCTLATPMLCQTADSLAQPFAGTICKSAVPAQSWPSPVPSGQAMNRLNLWPPVLWTIKIAYGMRVGHLDTLRVRA